MTRIPDDFVASPSINETGPGIPGVSITALIERLEKATGPSYVLDDAIHSWRYSTFAPGMEHPTIPPAYTASMDAALTLVPEGCAWQVGCEIDFTPTALVWGHDIHHDEWGATPVLALCIAALKARASRDNQTDAEGTDAAAGEATS